MSDASAPAPTLHCLTGRPPPPELAGDLRLLLELPVRARARLWDALGPALVDPIPDELEAHLSRFCAEHGVADEALARPLKASRFLLHAAAEVDIDRARMAEDLETLGGADAARLHELLLPGFEAAKRVVGRGLARRSLEQHGKVVTRAAWRLERIVASSEGDNLDAAVAVVTFDVLDGGRPERITLQIPPDALAELARAHARLIR